MRLLKFGDPSRWKYVYNRVLCRSDSLQLISMALITKIRTHERLTFMTGERPEEYIEL